MRRDAKGGPAQPLLFHNYDRHLECQQALRLPDFSPQSQDWAALHLIRERGAMSAVDAGRLSMAIDLCAAIWASLPGEWLRPARASAGGPTGSLSASWLNGGGLIRNRLSHRIMALDI